MITSAKECHIEQIITLWSNAFGDSQDSVKKYLETLLEYFIVYEEDSVVKGMLSVLPVTLKNKRGGYIYAVVTHPEYRGKGICRSLIDSVKANKKYDFLVLVPQNKSLFDFYGKMEFLAVSFLKKDEIITSNQLGEYSLKHLTSGEYENIRNKFYKNENFIKWDKSLLDFARDMYKGDFCEVLKDEKSMGYAFLYKEKEAVFVKEMLCENHQETAEVIGEFLDAEKVEFVYEDTDAEPTYMVYPKAFSDSKFGIFLD